MTVELSKGSETVQEQNLCEDEGQLILDAFDAGFEAGVDDLGQAPAITPNPHEPRTVLFYVWAIGYEHGGL